MLLDSETLKWFASLGVGGILAGVFYQVGRKDSERHIKAWEGMTEILIQIVKDNTTAITANTKVTESLIPMVREIQNDLRSNSTH